MIGLANVGVLPAHLGPSCRKFSVDEGARKCNHTPDNPHSQNQGRAMHLARDHVRIHEDARADDAAHHDHRGIEQSQPTRKSWR